MNKYEEMSDFEINKAVLRVHKGYKGAQVTNLEKPSAIGFPEKVYIGNTLAGWKPKFFDYCNNPADAWPVIVSNKISISPISPYLPDHDPDLWCASVEAENGEIDVWDKNPLRAAMIVFLMMQEEGK